MKLSEMTIEQAREILKIECSTIDCKDCPVYQFTIPDCVDTMQHASKIVIDSMKCCGNCESAFYRYDEFDCHDHEDSDRDDELPITPWQKSCTKWRQRK